MLGVGADMTYVLKPLLHEVPASANWTGYAIPHPHNVYLQVWFELGLVGVLLLLISGLCSLTRIAHLRLLSVPTPLPCSRREQP